MADQPRSSQQTQGHTNEYILGGFDLPKRFAWTPDMDDNDELDAEKEELFTPTLKKLLQTKE